MKSTTFFKLLLILYLFSFSITGALGATITSTATGNWSAGGTWVGGVAPVSADDVIIASGHTATLTMTSGDLSGTGTVRNFGALITFTTGSNNTSTTFSGVIGTGAIAVTKDGTGMTSFTVSGQTIGGSASTTFYNHTINNINAADNVMLSLNLPFIYK